MITSGNIPFANSIAISFFFFLATFTSRGQTIFHVKPGATGHSGLSWSEAFGNPQQAIDSAQAGDQIWVAGGTYIPKQAFDTDLSLVMEDREKTFYLSKNIQIYGGFSGNELLLEDRNLVSNPVFFSGDLGFNSDTVDNSYHIMYLDVSEGTITRDCTIDGITFLLGNANHSNFPHSAGSAIFLNGNKQNGACNPTIRNCRFEANYSSYAGAIYCDGRLGEASPAVTNCAFEENESYAGAGVYCNGYQGRSSPVFQDCIFRKNKSSYAGGAIFSYCNKGQGSQSLVNCIFSENVTTIGGAVYSSASEGNFNIRFISCVFNANVAHHKAGGIFNFGYLGRYQACLNNCVFYGNHGIDHGGALFNWFAQINLINSIFWNNADEIHNSEGGIVQMNYCIYEDAMPNNNILTLPHGTTGIRNLDFDPKFIAQDSGNFRLQQNSPALDAGIPDTSGLYLPATDLDENERLNGIIDLGPYENPFINCPDKINIQVNYSPLNGHYHAKQEIQLDENSLINSLSTTVLSAPLVIINPGTNVVLGGILETSQAGCNP